MAMQSVPRGQLARYSAMSIPLAFVGLPIYVHVPHYYATTHGIELVTISLILLCARFVDAFQDPLIGMLSDRSRFSRLRIMSAAMPLLIAGFCAIFIIPEGLGSWVIAWMIGSLLLTYTAFSTIIINYYAAGLPLAYTKAGHTRVSAYREGALMVGVIIAAALPSMLSESYDAETAYRYFSLIFIPIALLCMFSNASALWKQPRNYLPSPNAKTEGLSKQLTLFALPDIRRILLLFFCNSLPTAITSTLFLFYVEDVIQAPSHSGYMLIVFFASAACTVGMWNHLSTITGRMPALMIGMVLAIISISYAAFLGDGDIIPFYAVCCISGVAVAADLTLLPSLYAERIDEHPQSSSLAFSLWHFLSKLNLSLAAIIALPALAWLGYNPQNDVHTSNAIMSLTLAYAAVPATLKLISLYIAHNIHRKPIT